MSLGISKMILTPIQKVMVRVGEVPELNLYWVTLL